MTDKFQVKILTTILIVTCSFQLFGQKLKERNVAYIIPAVGTKINGLAGGLIINSLKDKGDSLTTLVNGINVEIVGVGFFAPIAPSHPMFREPDSVYQNVDKRDSIIKTYDKIKYKINGIAISGGGLGGHDIGVNGLNLSGINTLTAKINGVSLCILMNYSGVVNGVSASIFFNGTIQTKGLQIGLFNRTTKLRGIQQGLWNINEKRSLPFINWNFR